MELEARGLRAVHASEEDLARADARTLLECAIEDECWLVTRNYADFSDVATAFRHAGREFPGVLFMPFDAGSPAQQADRIVEWLGTRPTPDPTTACHWLTDRATP